MYKMEEENVQNGLAPGLHGGYGLVVGNIAEAAITLWRMSSL
jgi:hypothetical protein